MDGKTYGQYCGLARALDHVGERWTLLIVRELLVGPRRYSELRAALPGIATNLLAARLRALAADGIVHRGEAGGTYELTEFGRGLEDAVHGLVRWGGRWMGQRSRRDLFRAEWLVIALRAILPGKRRGRVELRVDDAVLHIERGRVGLGPLAAPEAIVEGAAERVLAVAAGRASLTGLTIRGDRKAAAAALGAST